MRVARTGLTLFAGWLAGVSAYCLVLLGAATRWRALRADSPDAGARRFCVLVPAHDEAAIIGSTVQGLIGLDYPSEHFEVVVVADNCTDATAELARSAGARVLERHDPVHRGKGQALAWAIPRVLRADPGPDAVVVVDADCAASSNLLAELDVHLSARSGALQVADVVGNPEDSPVAALRWAAFALINTVRPLGKDALGLSCGLKGTGMAFDREVLERRPWSAFGLIEDQEYHLSLVDAGERVAFVPAASVSSAMPTSFAEGRDQDVRWTTGQAVLARRWTGRLVRQGLRERDPVRLHAALEPLLPSQSRSREEASPPSARRRSCGRGLLAGSRS
jgi:cellulose synthase/poly-beta-1,6-N-acetylglucosamine synthase-like glycosyltransferase